MSAVKQSIEELESELNQAEADPVEFFGANADSILSEIQRRTHPDRWISSGMEDRAAELFRRFGVARELARSTENIGEYRVVRQLAKGDLTKVLIAKKSGRQFLIKDPVVAAKSLVKLEANTLKALAGSENSETLRKMIPSFVETVDGRNVFEFKDGLETLDSIQKRHGALDGRHVGWIFKRILMALGMFHDRKIVHGAITPDHVLISKADHGAMICGWIHCGAPDTKLQVVPKSWKSMYPAWSDKTRTFALDIAMAASCINVDNCPGRLARFVSGCRTPAVSRYVSAWQLHDDCSSVLSDLYGKPKFVVLD